MISYIKTVCLILWRMFLYDRIAHLILSNEDRSGSAHTQGERACVCVYRYIKGNKTNDRILWIEITLRLRFI